MGNNYLDSLSGEPMAWFKRKSVRLAVLCLAILAVVLIVLFSKQIGDLLELWGLKAAPSGPATSVVAVEPNCPAGKSCIQLFAVSSLVKLHNAAGPYADLQGLQTSSFASVSAAKNEEESFQLIIKADLVNLKGVQLSVSLLSGLGTIAGENVELFYEHFVFLANPTDDLGGTGYWADALPPLNNKFDIKRGENAAIWVKIKVPKTAIAGSYSGKITVIAENARPVELPVQLQVWNFALPDRPSMSAVFGFGNEDIRVAYGFDPIYDKEKLNQKLREYAEFMLEHGVSPFSSGISYLYPRVTVKAGSVSVEFTQQQKEDLQYFITRYRPTFWQFPIHYGMEKDPASFLYGLEEFSEEFNERMKQYIEKTSVALQDIGVWDGPEFFTWVADEPKCVLTPEDARKKPSYEDANKWSALIASASPRPKFMITEQITPEAECADPEKQLKNIDIWSPNVRIFMGPPNLRCPPYCENEDKCSYAKKEWWWYNGGGGGDFPGLQIIDRPSASSRVLAWYTKLHGQSAYMLWATTVWGNDEYNPWNEPRLWDRLVGLTNSFPNGNGYLFYPSTKISQYTPMMDTAGVTTSIRWETFVDGMEDYDYLSMASACARNEALESIITKSPCGYGLLSSCFSKNAQDYENARQSLADDITGVKKCTGMPIESPCLIPTVIPLLP